MVPHSRRGTGERISADDVMGEEPDALIRTAASALRSEQLLSFLMGQRWFGAKGLSPTHVAIGDCIVLPWGNSRYAIARLVVGGAAGERVYQLPLGVREVASPTSSETTIANLEHDGRTLAVYDAAHDEDFRAGLVDALVGGATIQEGETRWVAEAIHADWDPGNRSTSVGSAEQSNTSIVIGGRAIYKLFRSLMPGIHPDVEVTRFLTTTAGFPNVPALLAETRIEAAGQMLTTGMAQ